MLSPLLALFIRSLREDSRLKLTYFARAGLAVIILLFQFTIDASTRWGAGAPGLMFFSVVITIDFFFILLAGVSYFSSAVSEEKEEVTLGLLRMTNLNSLSILLGKSTSRLCNTVLLLAAQIPFTLLAITLGGISLRQVAAAYVAVGAFLIFVSNLALLASVVCRRTSSAAVMTGVFLFTFFAVVPIASWCATLPFELGLLQRPNVWVNGLQELANLAWLASPFSRLAVIFTTGFDEGAFSFQAWSNLALGAVFFLLSWALFERFCGEQRESEASRSGVARARGRWAFLSPGRAWKRALMWKDFHFFSGGKLWMGIKFLIYGMPLLIARCWPKKLSGPVDWEILAGATFWFMIVFIAVELVFAVASIFRIERQGQTLSSLAMLPQGIRRVAYEKLLGIVPSLSAAIVYLLASLPFNAKVIREFFGEIAQNGVFDFWGVLAVVFVFSQGIFFLHLVANLSLRVKRGALPLSIGIYFLLFVFVGLTSVGLIQDKSGFILLLVLTVGATVSLHINIGQRLELLASED